MVIRRLLRLETIKFWGETHVEKSYVVELGAYSSEISVESQDISQMKACQRFIWDLIHQHCDILLLVQVLHRKLPQTMFGKILEVLFSLTVPSNHLPYTSTMLLVAIC